MRDFAAKRLGKRAGRVMFTTLLAASLLLVSLWALRVDSANDPQTAEGAGAAPRKTFECVAVGPDGKTVPEIEVEVRSRPPITAEQVLQGTFLKKGNYGSYLKTDAEGRLALSIPIAPESFSLSISAAGYGPYWAGWNSRNSPQPIPEKLTAELDPAWSVGGIVVDDQGKPVRGAKLHPSIRFKKRPGDEEDLYVGDSVTTDGEGKWRYDSVPVSLSEVNVEITHANFVRLGRALPRNQFGLAGGARPTERLTIDRGLIVKGTVTDERQQPLKGALVRTKFLNDIREATTDEAGNYQLTGCEKGMAKIVVSAKGRATDMQEVRVDEALGPIDFKLPAGGKVRVRVLDEQDQPVAKARIFFQQWRGRFQYFEFDHIRQYADDKGIWQWDEAPLDGFLADICRPGGMQLGRQALVARDEEYVFRVPPALVITGKVIDADTREPIKSFRVIPGVRSSETHMNWVPWQTFAAADGQFTLRQTHDSFAHLVKVEAMGYLAAESRDIKSDEGNVTIEFALQKGRDVAATVLTPDGWPAAKAQIALGIAGSQISIANGEFDGQTYATRGTTDEAGKFSFAPQAKPFQLIILHPTGYAHIKSGGEPIPEKITLVAWARVSGTFRIGERAIVGAPITINAEGPSSYGDDVPSIFTHHDVTTGAGGRFALERVFPGRGTIGKRMMLTVENGAKEATSSIMYPATFEAGQEARHELGGGGTAVVGKLLPPDGFQGPALWNFALVAARLDTPPGLRIPSPYITASVDRDGNFRIDDMPAGDYRLSVRFDRQPIGRLAEQRFLVPAAAPGQAEQLIDIGVFKLE